MLCYHKVQPLCFTDLIHIFTVCKWAHSLALCCVSLCFSLLPRGRWCFGADFPLHHTSLHYTWRNVSCLIIEPLRHIYCFLCVSLFVVCLVLHITLVQPDFPTPPMKSWLCNTRSISNHCGNTCIDFLGWQWDCNVIVRNCLKVKH